MTITSDTKLYCLLGHPVTKSLSPNIHNISFKENKIDARYLTFDVLEEDLQDALKGIIALGIKGFNVTIPHKINIIKYLDDLDEGARLLGAVNTVKNIDGKLIGYNTDGEGFRKMLIDNQALQNIDKVVILGAGGAARAIAITLAKLGTKEITILNRTVDKAKKLADYINNILPYTNTLYNSINTSNLHEYHASMVINCTPIGMTPNINKTPIDPLLFSENATMIDIIYKPLITKFLCTAKSNGYKIIGGIEMLINQAILSEEIWLDMKIKTDIVEEIKKEIGE